MTYAGNELPHVTQALIEEAKMGNIQAAKLILEHFGKLTKNIHIKIQSPFDNWMSSQNIDYEVVKKKPAELVEINEVLETIEEPTNVIPVKRSKKGDYNKKQREWYYLRQRAKKVGLEIFKGRTSTGRRKTWIKELERRETNMI